MKAQPRPNAGPRQVAVNSVRGVPTAADDSYDEPFRNKMAVPKKPAVLVSGKPSLEQPSLTTMSPPDRRAAASRHALKTFGWMNGVRPVPEAQPGRSPIPCYRKVRAEGIVRLRRPSGIRCRGKVH